MIAAAVAIVAIVAVIAASVLGGDGEESRAAPERAQAAGVSLDELQTTAASIPHPVYWTGPQPGRTYELTRTADGRTYIRYLPEGTKVGSARGDFLTVGTYPQEDALETLRATAKTQGAELMPLESGGYAFQDVNRPTSVYAAFPGLDLQVEVFDPGGAQARELVRDGRLAPLVRPASERATVADLRQLPTELGQPVYLAGPDRDMTYELTRTKGGRVFIRYLPSGVEVGDPRADYLTVATYPQADALAALKAEAAKVQATTIELPGGALAYFDRARPTSAYIARPGEDLTVEVYTPDRRRTEEIVTGREIVPVG